MLTKAQGNALCTFWLHMCNRIARDANIQYYCGAMTQTLKLAVDTWVALHPEKTRDEVENELLMSRVSDDSDKVRLKRRIEELESGVDHE